MLAEKITGELRPGDSSWPLDSCLVGCGSLHQFAEALGNAVDAKDSVTFNHSREVAHLSYWLAQTLGLSPHDANIVHLAGHLHDIGKIGVPDAILQKGGMLSSQEWQWVRKHPVIGAKILAPVEQFGGPGGVCEIVRHHHERYDGDGYPDGLTAHQIPLGARIIAVADTLSALLQHRPYRRGTSMNEALAEISRCSQSQFDPQVVEALLQCGWINAFFPQQG